MAKIKKPAKAQKGSAMKSKAKKNAPRISPKSKASAKKPAKLTQKPMARKPAPRPNGLPEQLCNAALKVLDDRQAEDVVKVDLIGKSSLADYLIVASGRASRQLGAIAHYLREAFARLGARKIRIEGLPEANWVLIDAGDVVVHLFRPEVRRYYNLESILQDKDGELKKPALRIK